ncbi:hypothetical protein GCM10023157_16070 [Gluconacetobacter asukensis]
MALLFDDIFPNGHDYNKIPFEFTDNPMIIAYILRGIEASCPEAVDVIAGLLNRLDSREIGLQHICSSLS